MKHPLESLLTAGGILLMAFLSCLLLPAPSLGLALAQKLVGVFHLMDLNQLYTLLFCVWFLALGAVEFFLLRFVWRRGFFSQSLNCLCFTQVMSATLTNMTALVCRLCGVERLLATDTVLLLKNKTKLIVLLHLFTNGNRCRKANGSAITTACAL
jgi:Protein of unknown function (DUF1158).